MTNKVPSSPKDDEGHDPNDHQNDYRTIAKKMSLEGFKMNHSSVRNYFIRVMEKFVVATAEKYGIPLDSQRVKDIANSVSFHRIVSNVMNGKHDR